MTFAAPNTPLSALTFGDLETLVAQLVQRELQQDNHQQSWQLPQLTYTETAQPFWEIMTELAAEVPAQDWAEVPTDASERLNAYLYNGQ